MQYYKVKEILQMNSKFYKINFLKTKSIKIRTVRIKLIKKFRYLSKSGTKTLMKIWFVVIIKFFDSVKNLKN